MKATELARKLADALELAGIPYAVGGALAYGYWAPPRATNDVDLDIFLDENEIDRAFEALESTGATLDRSAARQMITTRCDFRAELEGMRIDVFVAFARMHEGVRERRQRVPLRGRDVWVLSAEDLLIFKMLFDRPKDWIDIEAMVAVRASNLDERLLQELFEEWVGPGDSRLDRLRGLLGRYR